MMSPRRCTAIARLLEFLPQADEPQHGLRQPASEHLERDEHPDREALRGITIHAPTHRISSVMSCSSPLATVVGIGELARA